MEEERKTRYRSCNTKGGWNISIEIRQGPLPSISSSYLFIRFLRFIPRAENFFISLRQEGFCTDLSMPDKPEELRPFNLDRLPASVFNEERKTTCFLFFPLQMNQRHNFSDIYFKLVDQCFLHFSIHALNQLKKTCWRTLLFLLDKVYIYI